MQGLWYGDKRDRVKWGALVYLAKEENIPCIVQVAYFRHGPDLKLKVNECGVEREVELSQAVWDHFSDLRHIERLGESIGLEIIVLDQCFDHVIRGDYIDMIASKVKEVECHKIIFLDPDTGIEPKKAKPEHVTIKDLQKIWEALRHGDLLVIYQHAAFTENWLSDRKGTMSSACSNVDVGTITGIDIAADVAMLWCCKPNIETTKTNKEKNKFRHCACQCCQVTRGGYFYPGHDAKLKSTLRKIDTGKIIKKDVNKTILKIYEIWSKDKSKPLKEIAMEILGE